MIWRHKKRGTLYAQLGSANLQSSAGPVLDNDEVVAYIGLDDGRMWVRPTDEFLDGRFEAVPDDGGEFERFVKQWAETLVEMAEAHGVTVTIEQKPRTPLAMGNYDTVVSTRKLKK
jgi:nucleotide-binding universal stress UspA family protein